LLWILAIIAAVLMLAAPASAQFMVTPMKIELGIWPGRTAEEIFVIRNLSEDRVRIIDLKLVEVTQSKDAHWQIIEEDSDIDTSKLSSCAEWINFSTNSVRIGPLGKATVTIKVKAPPRTRGFYIAGLTAQTRPAPDITGIPVVVRFLVPILVEIQGRPMRSKIELTDVGMEFREQRGETPATTLASIRIANAGKTYSRLKGTVTVKNFSAGHWRKITTAEFKEVSIIPGAELNIKSDLQRSLPTGKYELEGALYVDGRRVKPLQREMDFAGDPSVTRVAADAALDIEPASLSITSVPGATRSAALKVRNASDSTVDVRVASVIPPVLKGVAFGELRGEDLACAEWIKVLPEKFTLRAGARQTIRIIAKMPRAESMHANYYASLGLWARYTDGQNAGVTMALLNVENKRIEVKPTIQPMKLTLAIQEASTYAIVARFGNVGNIHIRPRCSATLTMAGGRIVRRTLLAGESGLMLPLEVRNFSGVLDFATIAAGTYRLEAILEYTTAEGVTERMTQGISMRVSVEGEQRIVEIIE